MVYLHVGDLPLNGLRCRDCSPPLLVSCILVTSPIKMEGTKQSGYTRLDPSHCRTCMHARRGLPLIFSFRSQVVDIGSVGGCEARACYSAELHVSRRTVTTSTSQTRLITILLCSLCTLSTAKQEPLKYKTQSKTDLNCVHEDKP